jgi:hypothetical protein
MNLRLFIKIPHHPLGFFDHSNNAGVLRKQPILARSFHYPGLSITDRIAAV